MTAVLTWVTKVLTSVTAVLTQVRSFLRPEGTARASVAVIPGPVTTVPTEVREI